MALVAAVAVFAASASVAFATGLVWIDWAVVSGHFSGYGPKENNWHQESTEVNGGGQACSNAWGNGGWWFTNKCADANHNAYTPSVTVQSTYGWAQNNWGYSQAIWAWESYN